MTLLCLGTRFSLVAALEQNENCLIFGSKCQKAITHIKKKLQDCNIVYYQSLVLYGVQQYL